MDSMCFDSTTPPDQSDSLCSSWVSYDHPIDLLCDGHVTYPNVCISLFDYDEDIDVDLKDFAVYQNYFDKLRPLP
ncbi:MAG: hypothetical protein ACXAC5_02655 [Promethearchaeota archaeon]